MTVIFLIASNMIYVDKFNCEQLFQLNVSTATNNSYQLFLTQRFNSNFILYILTVNNSQQINVTSAFKLKQKFSNCMIRYNKQPNDELGN